jgi:hypothetical protein
MSGIKKEDEFSGRINKSLKKLRNKIHLVNVMELSFYYHIKHSIMFIIIKFLNVYYNPLLLSKNKF